MTQVADIDNILNPLLATFDEKLQADICKLKEEPNVDNRTS